MKRILPYGLLKALLILSMAVLSANIWENSFDSYHRIAHVGEFSSPFDDHQFYAIFNTPAIPAGLTQIIHSRASVSVANAIGNSHFLLKSYFSLFTRRQLSVTESIYISFFSQKEKDGYYLYALRKLLI